jgi:hypothetical protein
MQSDKRGEEGFATTVLGNGMVRNKSFQQDSITTFAFAESEGPRNWQVLHYFLWKPSEKRGQYVLNQAVAGYDDLGSGYFSNPCGHWFAKIWPKVEQATRKDTWHGVTLVTRSTDGASHPLNDGFSKELACCLLRFTWSSIVEVSREYLKKKSSVTPQVAWLDVVPMRNEWENVRWFCS